MDKKTTDKAERLFGDAKLTYVPVEKMRVREMVAQRAFRQAWGDHIAQNFNPDAFEPLVVNKVGDWYWIVDGQHRKYAACQWLEDFRGQKFQCWVYSNLSEGQEAELYDLLNSRKAASSFERYVVRITAGREVETNVDAIVRLQGMKVSHQKGERCIACPSTLCRIYHRGADCLSRVLKLVDGGFGDSGLESDILSGVAEAVGRYDSRLDDKVAINALHSLRGGVNELRSRAERIRQTTGLTKPQCIAAAIVQAYNRKNPGKKLPGWLKE